MLVNKIINYGNIKQKKFNLQRVSSLIAEEKEIANEQKTALEITRTLCSDTETRAKSFYDLGPAVVRAIELHSKLPNEHRNLVAKQGRGEPHQSLQKRPHKASGAYRALIELCPHRA